MIPHGLIKVPREEILRAQGVLSVTSRESETFEDRRGPITVQMWHDDPDGKHIWVPRHYAKTYGLVNPVHLDQVRARYPADYVFQVPLWDLQRTAVEQTVHQLTKHESGILRAKCGAGKTVMSLKVAAEMGLKTLIVVNKEYLMLQWRNRIEQFLGIGKDQVGIIQQAKCQTDKPICIAMVQTLFKKDYKQGKIDRFGLVCFDEVHRLGAPLQNVAAAKVAAPYRLGLSATPDRGDGLDDVIRWHIGGIISVCQAETSPVEIWEYKTGAAINSDMFTNDAGQHRPDLVQRMLARNQDRNAKLGHLIQRAYNAGRKTLVLSHFLDHLRGLRKTCGVPEADTGYFCGQNPERPRDVYTLAGDDPEEFVHFLKTNLDPKEVTTRQHKGVWKVTALGLERPAKLSRKIRGKFGVTDHRRSMSKLSAEELVESADKRVIFASYSMAREALDIATLDTEILATPAGGIEQAIGRIARVHPDKLSSVVIDPVDYDYGQCLMIFRRMRQRTYRNLGYPVKIWGEKR